MKQLVKPTHQKGKQEKKNCLLKYEESLWKQGTVTWAQKTGGAHMVDALDKVPSMLKRREKPNASYLKHSVVTGLAEDLNRHCFKLALFRKTDSTIDFIIAIIVCMVCVWVYVQEPACGARRTTLRSCGIKLRPLGLCHKCL